MKHLKTMKQHQHINIYLISFSACNERFPGVPPLPSVAMVTSEFISHSASSSMSPSELLSAFKSWEAGNVGDDGGGGGGGV